MASSTHHVMLSKPAKRQLRDNVIESNLSTILARVNTKSLKVMGWTVDAGIGTVADEEIHAWRRTGEAEDYTYELYLLVNYDHASKEEEHSALAAILRTIDTAAQQPAMGKWKLSSCDNLPYVRIDGADITTDELIGYTSVEIPDDWDDNFDHLYGLDAHIGRVRKAIEAGIESGWNNRYHCALVGPPGCGKSDICRSIKAALGNDAVMEFDATATTAAGAIKELTEREILPRVLIVEEIEKADEKALSFLLSVCDLRGEIRKTTARTTVQRDTKLFVIATVNDVPLFDKLNAGALSSRFANKVWFKRPSRELLAKILTREIQKVKGDIRWINPTLDYAEEHGINDPRQISALCLCGRDDWLTGEFQTMMDATSDPGDMGSPLS